MGQGIELPFGHFSHCERFVELQTGADLGGGVLAYAAELKQGISHWSVPWQEFAEDVRHRRTVDNLCASAFAAILIRVPFFDWIGLTAFRTATVPPFSERFP